MDMIKAQGGNDHAKLDSSQASRGVGVPMARVHQPWLCPVQTSSGGSINAPIRRFTGALPNSLYLDVGGGQFWDIKRGIFHGIIPLYHL
jgi:hypothetical protein